MHASYNECGIGKYAEWNIPPEMLHEELIVSTSAQQESITPSTGKKIRVHRIFATCKIGVALTTTVNASLSQGTGGVSDPTKIIMRINHTKGDTCNAMWSPSLNIVGAVNETITLTNHTFSAGSVTMTMIIYYTED